MKTSRVPAATITRLSLYARCLEDLAANDVSVASSDQLAEMCRVNPAQVRKDLAYFGEFGVRGVGYYVQELLFEIRKILGLTRKWSLALIGMGNLGTALATHGNFERRGYIFVALFDNDPEKIGHRLPSGLIIDTVNDLVSICRERKVDIGVIATPAGQVAEVVDRLVEVPVGAMLNFAPIQIQAPEGFRIENVDFTVKLDNLAYHLTTR